MMENPKNFNENRDELDLLSLVEDAISFFKKFGITIIIFSILGLSFGALRYVITPNEYFSTLILHSRIITNQEQLQILRTWNDLLKKKEYDILALNLNSHPDVLKKVSKISGEEIQKLYVPENPNGFLVGALVKDTSILDALQEAILYGLQNNEYIKERINLQKIHLNSLIQKVKTEISALDSTKANVESIINNKNQNQSSFIIDVTDINTQLIELNEKLLSYEEDLRFVNAVQVLQKFNKLKNPEKPKLLSSLVLGLIGGIFIGYFIALFRYVKQKLRDRAKTRLQVA